MSMGEEKLIIIIPPEILAFFIPIALLAIAVSLTRILIMGGIKLLDSDIQVLIRKFGNLKSALDQKMEKLKEAYK